VHRVLRRLVRLLAVLYLATWVVNRSLRAVDGGSMRPTLAQGDRVLVLPPALLRPRRGAVVVLPDPRTPERTTIKRVAALPGERLRVEGTELVAGANQLIVLGDDPGASTDSRVYGPVAAADVRAVAITAIRPFRWLWPRRTGGRAAPRGR
jgi:signal peptidase I